MSTWTGRFAYLTEKESAASIARATGIPYRTVLSVRAGAELPSEFVPSAVTYWKKATYARLVAVGVPSRIANNLRGGALEPVQSVEIGTAATVNYLARGATMMHFGTRSLNISDPVVESYYEELQRKIRESLSRTDATYEEYTDREHY